MSDVGTLVYEEERRVLDWFSQFLENASSSFATSAFYFDKYYRKCVDSLYHLPYKREKKNDIKEGFLDAIYLEDMEDFKSKCSYNRILEHMKKNPDFLYEAVNNNLISESCAHAISSLPTERLGKMTKEEVDLLMRDPNYVSYVADGDVDRVLRDKKTSDEEVEQSLVPLLKLYRLNNLQVKYAHTARIVYLTDLEVNKLGVQDDLVKSILYTSALFHDVGRFYQGTYYNSYSESDLKKIENGNVNDHAEAGYYYSLLDMINLNVLGSASNEDLIIHSLASVVVKKHQLPNANLGNYDKMISSFEFNSSIKQELLDFVLSCYGEADKFEGGLHGRFKKTVPGSAELMRQSFTDGMLNIMSSYTGDNNLEGVRDAIYGLFSYETPSLVLDDENIDILRNSLQGDELTDLERRVLSGEKILLSPLYNKVIREYKLGSLLGKDNNNSPVITEFVQRFIEMSESSDYYSQYDIVSIIDKVIEADGKGEEYRGIKLNDDVAKVLRMSMGLVMDMDKLDILVQRAIKRYPDWKPNGIQIKALCSDSKDGLTSDESLIDVLENQFEINIKYDAEGKIVLDDVLIDIIKHNANVNDEFKKKFGENFDFSSLEEGQSLDDTSDMAMKSSYHGKIVSMPYDLMEKAHPDLMERYRIEMDLILPKDLRENVFKEDYERRKDVGSNGIETAFPLGPKASEEKRFVWGNAFPGVWWQLDQFVTTNMRSMESLRFIKETGLLERIGDAYKLSECPEEFGLFIDEIIGFSHEFIDLALTAKINANGDLIFDEDNKEGYSPVVLSDKDVMLRIRNEAAVRHRENNYDVSYEDNHSDQLQSMFDEPTLVGGNANINDGDDLNSMMSDYNTSNRTANSVALPSEKK